MHTEIPQLTSHDGALGARVFSDSRLNRERNAGKQVCRVATSFFPSFNEFTWGPFIGRITRAVIHPAPEDEYQAGSQSVGLAPELNGVSTETLVQSATTMRFRLGWMALRDARFDVWMRFGGNGGAFIDWLKLQPAETLQTWAAMFVSDWSKGGSPGEAAFRLARLKPTPLPLLWPFHCWHEAQLPAISSDRADAEDAYIMGLLACQARRMANDTARFPAYLLSETAHDLSITLPAMRKKIQIANELATTFSLAVYEEAEATAATLLAGWATAPPSVVRATPVTRVGPTCRVCANRAANAREPGWHPSVPPFRVGCTCELLFDSEYLPLLEADFVSDLLFWSSRAGPRSWRWFPLRRMLLATAERQILRDAVDYLKFSAATKNQVLTLRASLPHAPTKVGEFKKRSHGTSRAPPPRSGPLGTLKAAVVRFLQDEARSWVSTNAIAAAVQTRLQLRFESGVDRQSWLKGNLGKALRDLYRNFEVARRETGDSRNHREWRLTTDAERQANAPPEQVRPALALKLL